MGSGIRETYYILSTCIKVICHKYILPLEDSGGVGGKWEAYLELDQYPRYPIKAEPCPPLDLYSE